VLASFIAHAQNKSAISSIDQSRSLRMVISFLKTTLVDIEHRSCNTARSNSEISRQVSRLDSLYKFLRPTKKNRGFRVRSLPNKVIDDIFKISKPTSPSNPFRTLKGAWRNYVIVCLLYYQGLRRGELLNLTADCMKSEFDFNSQKQIYWLNVIENGLIDTRTNKPRLKNKYSQRQIPLSVDMFNLLQQFTLNWRGKCSHGYLLSSNRGQPLSERSLNDIFKVLNVKVSLTSKQVLFESTGLRNFTSHSFRHTSAVARIKAYREMGISMDEAEALMRAFFGWSRESMMPRFYAKAFYEDQIHILSDAIYDHMHQASEIKNIG